jgi:hypothetical protein
MPFPGDSLQTWLHIEQRSHVGGLFLDPDKVFGVRMTFQDS